MRVKRRYPRWIVTNWTLRYKEANKEGQEFMPSRLVNVSRGGICFETDQEFDIGAVLTVELTSDAFPAPIIAQGKVMWCRRSKVSSRFEVGVEFGEVAWDTLTHASAAS